MAARSQNALQPSLFPNPVVGPQGFAYEPELVSPSEETAYAARFADLPFAPFEFHGFLGKRRIVSFGWHYDYGQRHLQESDTIPDFLLPLRDKAAAFARLDPESLRQVLVTEYAPGAGIGWHRDKPMFDDVIAFSFLSACTLRFRAKEGPAWRRMSIEAQPRSAYLLRGPARLAWEHSVPPVAALRYSVTFRNFIRDFAA